MKNKKKLGIALSGGGARGIAHIGVLQALEEHNIFPEIISGTSAGSIVGALYAAGNTPAQILEFARETSVLKAIKLGLPTQGFTDLSALSNLLEGLIPVDDFDALLKPLYISVTNLTRGELEVFSTGSVYEAVVASCSIPLFFKPVNRGEDLLVDGGVLQNLPVESIRLKCETLIGVNVMPIKALKKEDLQGMVDIANRSFELSIQINTEPSLSFCDIIIEPQELSKYHVYNFRKVEEIYEIGYTATKEKIDAIQKMLKKKELKDGLELI